MARVEHWDRDRYLPYERDRMPFGGERRERLESHDHLRGPGSSGRDYSGERYDRRPRASEDDLYVRDRRSYHDEPRLERRGYDRDIVLEKDRSRDVVRELSPPPVRRPGILRRQSSLDTFDRRPLRFYEREERYGPPARREDVAYRPEPYVPIPLPITKTLPPPRRMDERYYEEIRVADPNMHGDDEFRPYPERVRERDREVVRKERRGRRVRSPDSMTSRSYTRTSRSSSVSSRSSSRSRATTVQSAYPKKGKTRMPSRLVSKRALIDLGYPFIEEVSTICTPISTRPRSLTIRRVTTSWF